MKHPVLNVKKDAVVYDDTEARLSSGLPRPPLPGSGPFFSRRRRKRGIPLTFLPLVAIAAGLFIVLRLVPNTPVNRVTIEGWQATLRVTPYQGKLIIGVTFLSSAAVPVDPADAQEATVAVSLPGTGEQVLVAAALVKSPITLRGDLPRAAGAKKVQAVVRVGRTRAMLWVPAP
jgi:hypothetical protein